MNLATQTKLTRDSQSLAIEEQARQSCITAKQLERIGEYEAAVEALNVFWPDETEPAIPDSLDQATKADLLLRIGALIGWSGSVHQHKGKQETAKNLITRSIEIFQWLGESNRVAEAQCDLGVCYWREGAFDEARITFTNALDRLAEIDSDLKATLLIRAGIVESDTHRLNKALEFFNLAKPLVENSDNDALKGSFHGELALVLRRLGASATREDYFDKALIENAAASFHLERAGNHRYLARVENNLGFLLSILGRYGEAHRHLDRARHLFVELKHSGAVAQVDDTRARTFLAEGKLKEAERYARQAVRTLDRGDECSLLVEALTTYGTVEARLGKYLRARQLLDRAIETAETCGDLEGAGRARLAIIEELSAQNSPFELSKTFELASKLLKKSQDPSMTNRLISCAQIVIDALRGLTAENPPPMAESWDNFSLQEQVRSYEKALIERALRESGGAVTKAAYLLGFKHHQSLISLLNSRHSDLMSQRSAVRPRRRHLFSKSRKLKRQRSLAANQRSSQVRILHVEDHASVADRVAEVLRGEKWAVELCKDGDSALRKLTSDEPYDLLLLDNSLPGLSGVDLARRIRKITHRRRTPIIMLSAADYEREAWQAGVDAFLKKPEQVADLPATINRLLGEGRNPQ